MNTTKQTAAPRTVPAVRITQQPRDLVAVVGYAQELQALLTGARSIVTCLATDGNTPKGEDEIFDHAGELIETALAKLNSAIGLVERHREKGTRTDSEFGGVRLALHRAHALTSAAHELLRLTLDERDSVAAAATLLGRALESDVSAVLEDAIAQLAEAA